MKTLLVLALILSVQGDDKRLREKLEGINDFLKTARTPAAFRAAVEDLLAVGEDAIALDLYDLAIKAMEQADKIAKGVKDPSLMNMVQSKVSKARSLQQEWGRVKTFMKTLEGKPDDTEANLAVGRYLCAIKGDWEKGLAMLRKGSDATLRAIAEADSLGGANTEEKIQLAERWRNYSEKNPKFKERALFWYKEAWPGLRGIAKEQARSRAAELQSLVSGKDREWVPNQRIPAWTFSGESGLGMRYAVTGKLSARISNPKGQPSYVMMDRLPAAPGKEFVVTTYVLSDLIEAPGAHVAIYWYDKDNKGLPGQNAQVALDFPFWQRVEIKGTVPPEATVTAFDVVISSTKGCVWIDDVSIKVNGAEIIKNGSFEEK